MRFSLPPKDAVAAPSEAGEAADVGRNRAAAAATRAAAAAGAPGLGAQPVYGEGGLGLGLARQNLDCWKVVVPQSARNDPQEQIWTRNSPTVLPQAIRIRILKK